MKNSISRFVKYIGIDCKKLKHEFVPETHAKTYSFLEEISTTISEKPPETLINTAVILDVSDPLETVLNSWDTISNKPSSKTNIAASLVLVYPEIYWLFIGMYCNKPRDNPPWLAEHFVDPTSGMQKCIDLLKRHQDGYKPIFDPSGIRTWIKSSILNKEKENLNPVVFKETEQINNRRKDNSAVVIEEELPFTYLNGYTAYRSGCRCYMITSKSEIGSILNKKNKEITVSLEDLDIKLSGMSNNEVVKARNLYKRAEEHKALGSPDFCEEEFKQQHLTVGELCEVINCRCRFSLQSDPNTISWLNELLEKPDFYKFCKILTPQNNNPSIPRNTKILAKVTKNYKKSKDSSDKDQMSKIKRLNRLLIEEMFPTHAPKNRIKRLIVTGVATNEEKDKLYKNVFDIVDKPYAGIYYLTNYIDQNIHANYSFFIRWIYYIKKCLSSRYSQQLNSVKGNSHSAPSRILTNADFLIGRARKILDDAKNCEGFVIGAVLALEAKELLCGQSMTTSLEAVSLQHQLEVKAECSFFGVAHEIEVKPRFKEINSEVGNIVRNSGKKRSVASAQSYNTQLEIVNNIRRIFNDYEQFDEEERCIIKTRKFRQRLHWHQPWKKWWKWSYSLTIEWYLNFLMSNTGYIPWKLGGISLLWISLFAMVLTYCCPTQFSVNAPDFHASEFKQPSALGKLCRKTTKDGLGKHIHARIDTVNRLNELLQVPNLYDSMMRKHPEKFTDDVVGNTLVKEIKVYRDQRYLNLEGDAQDTIKTLNRHLLEEMYPEIVPKLDTSKMDASFGTVFKKSARLYLLTFLELSHQEELNGKSGLLWISILEIIVAHVHLGIFISYLFQKLARR